MSRLSASRCVANALADPTRRGLLRRLGRSSAAISELADDIEISLASIRKHVHVLETAGLVTTKKIGRVRRCALGPRKPEDASAWIEEYRRTLEDRLNRLEYFLERTGETS